MKITNVMVYGSDRRFQKGEIHIAGGKFVAPQEDTEPEKVVDGQGAYGIPGLVDIHFHGCMGADVCDAKAEALQKMAEYEASVGVTSMCPATMTVSEEELHRIMRVAGGFSPSCGAKLAGIHMEGPFISREKKGAQAEKNIRTCDIGLFRKLQEDAGGKIRLVDLAPETPGAMDFIRQVKDEVVVSLAHTTADYETSRQAFDAGASHVTHLYNAMPPFDHRKPGVVGAALEQENCHVELICDGVHIHPSVVRATFAMFGAERIILVSDSMRGTGLGDGSYTLGGQTVQVQGVRATLSDGTIAGSVSNLMQCLRTAVLLMQIPLEEAVACATINPAKEIGIFDRCGSIAPGKDADLLLLDRNLQIRQIFINGKEYKTSK
jgi:N-acetylglucosamine-6-phosphate deacetylase